MISSISTLGLKPENIIPEKFKTNVDINTEISIYFNSELDTSTIIGNIYILEDKNFEYTNGPVDLNYYDVIDGNLTYKDKSIIFTPKNQLNINSRYIIYIPKEGIRDIFGNVTLIDFISYFSTESFQAYAKCEILYPINNTTISSLEKISITDLNSPKYLVQISKIKTFDNLVLEETVDTPIVEKRYNIGDGLYFIRAKAINGEFGETNVFTIKSHENTIPTDQDLDEDYIWEEYVEEPEALIETFPVNDSIGINEKTNVLYMKFNGIIDIDDIDFYESYLIGEPNDNDDNISSHDEVDGSYTVIHDEEKYETYIFFIPNTL